MTLWRMRNDPKFPAGVVVRNTEYFYEDEMEAYEASHRRAKQCATATTQST
jgi:hypothetical protein